MKKVFNIAMVLLLTLMVAVSMNPVESIFAINTGSLPGAHSRNESNSVLLTADPATNTYPTGVDGFGTAASNGRVWADKTVTIDDNNFEVELSALTQQYVTRVIQEGTEQTKAADVLLILDITGSMRDNKDVLNDPGINGKTANNIQRTKAMVAAVNKAMDVILSSNSKNRVMVNVYGQTCKTLLPLDHYSTSARYGSYTENSTNGNGTDNIFGKYFEGTKIYLNYGKDKIDDGGVKTNATLKNGQGNTYTADSAAITSTRTQNALYQSMDPGVNTTSITKNISSQTKDIDRLPYVILLTDGAANYCYENYVTPTSGTTHSSSGDKIAAATILTARYQKDNMQNAYNKFNGKESPLTFFTVSLGGEVASDPNSLGLLNPSVAPDSVKKYIKTYYNQIGHPAVGGTTTDYSNDYIYVTQTASGTGYYSFNAQSLRDLDNAFSSLSSLVKQSTGKYTSPLENPDKTGNVGEVMNFKDVIGEGMQVDEDSLKVISGGDTYTLTKKNGEEGVYSNSALNQLSVNITENTTGGKPLQTLEWSIPAELLPEYAYDSSTDKFVAPTGGAIKLDYKVTADNIASLESSIYSNAYTTDGTDKTARTEVTFTPKKDNPYYYEDIVLNDETSEVQTSTKKTLSTVPKAQNNTDTADYSFKEVWSTDTTDTSAPIRVLLGNNGEILPVVVDKKDLERQTLTPITLNYAATTGGKVKKTATGDAATIVDETFPESTGTAEGAIAIPDKGYNFDGWYTDSSLEAKYKIADTAAFAPAKPAEGYVTETTYYAKFNPIDYNITYNLNGGTNDADNPKKYTYGKGVKSFASPTRIGYTFDGWYNAQTEGSPIASIEKTETGDKTLYARWSPNTDTTYIVKHLKQNLTDDNYTEVTKDREYNTGTTEAYTTAKAKTTYEGFTAQAVEQQKISADGTTEVEIKYTRNNYDIVYEYEGKIPAGAPSLPGKDSKKYDATEIAVEKNPELAGHSFSGWKTSDASVSEGKFTMPGKTVKFVGSWDTIVYNISYDLDNGKLAENQSNPPTYTKESEDIGLINPTREGYKFDGWTGSNGDTNEKTVTITKGSIGDKNFNAHWTPTDYKITYEMNGGDVSGNPDSYNIETQTITLNNPTREGYDFLGWTGSNGNATQSTVTVLQGEIGDKNFVAHWQLQTREVGFERPKGNLIPKEDPSEEEDIEVYYGDEIIVDPNTGDWNYDDKQYNERVTIKVKEDTVLESPSKKGFIFMGWKKSIDDKTGLVLFTASWEEDVFGADENINYIDEGDSIPDCYQGLVGFKIEHGMWEDGSDKPIIKVVTLMDDENYLSKEGQGTIDIPEGMVPDKGYDKDSGEWDMTPATVVQGTEPIIYTYSYTKEKVIANEGKTGDDAPLGPIGLLALLSMAGMGVTLTCRRREEK